MTYIDRIKASYEVGRKDTIRARQLARQRAAERKAEAVLAAKKAPPIRVVRAAGRIIEGSRPVITGAHKMVSTASRFSQQPHRKANIKIKPRCKPRKSMLW